MITSSARFNNDLPYDRFLIEQLAADRAGALDPTRAFAGGGTGYVDARAAVPPTRNPDIIDDRIDVVARGLLGLTVACARCHDHKFDPIPTDDYYSLYGIFASSVEPADPPEIPASVSDNLNRDFRVQLEARTKARDTFLDAKRKAVEADLRTHAGAYLKAGFALGFDGKSSKLDERAKADKLTPGRLRSFSMRLGDAGSWRRARASRTPCSAPGTPSPLSLERSSRGRLLASPRRCHPTIRK